MSDTSDLSALLTQRPIVLVVEDLLTKQYLAKVWGADEQLFNLRAVGGRDGVSGFVKDLRGQGMDHVFGLQDRDFGRSNFDRWRRADNPPDIFRPRFHEIENLLLDWPALAGCELNRHRNNRHTEHELEGLARAEAAKQPWWLACRRCLAQSQAQLSARFPTVPKLEVVSDYQDAFAHITTSVWFQSLPAAVREIVEQTSLEGDLRAAQAECANQLSTGEWKERFSGKEIFKVLLSRIYGVPRRVSRQADVDLAKSVARWQCDNNAVPEDIMELKNVLKQRVGL